MKREEIKVNWVKSLDFESKTFVFRNTTTFIASNMSGMPGVDPSNPHFVTCTKLEVDGEYLGNLFTTDPEDAVLEYFAQYEKTGLYPARLGDVSGSLSGMFIADGVSVRF